MTRSDAARHTQAVEHSRRTAPVVSHVARRATIGGHPGTMPAPSGIDQGHPRWCRVGDVRTVVGVDLAPPPADAAPAPLSRPTRPPPGDPPERIVGGVAALLAAGSASTRCGSASRSCCWRSSAVSASWSTAACGWCSSSAADADRDGRASPAALLLVLGLPLLLTGGFDFLDRAGGRARAARRVWRWRSGNRAAACGRHRRVRSPRSPATRGGRHRRSARARARRPPVDPRATDARRSPSSSPRSERSSTRPTAAGCIPSSGSAAAAVVCGIGLLVGALRGRALWLVIPAAAVRRRRIRCR